MIDFFTTFFLPPPESIFFLSLSVCVIETLRDPCLPQKEKQKRCLKWNVFYNFFLLPLLFRERKKEKIKTTFFSYHFFPSPPTGALSGLGGLKIAPATEIGHLMSNSSIMSLAALFAALVAAACSVLFFLNSLSEDTSALSHEHSAAARRILCEGGLASRALP